MAVVKILNCLTSFSGEMHWPALNLDEALIDRLFLLEFFEIKVLEKQKAPWKTKFEQLSPKTPTNNHEDRYYIHHIISQTK